MILTNENYFSKEADMEYLSVSQYKNFIGSLGKIACEAEAMALLNGVWEKVSHFRLFSVRDMSEIRECIRKIDPLFTGTTEIAHPTKGITDRYAIMTAPRFFFLTEA